MCCARGEHQGFARFGKALQTAADPCIADNGLTLALTLALIPALTVVPLQSSSKSGAVVFSSPKRGCPSSVPPGATYKMATVCLHI